ncbi:hypothetical protein [Streptomyces sp. NPDC002346]
MYIWATLVHRYADWFLLSCVVLSWAVEQTGITAIDLAVLTPPARSKPSSPTPKWRIDNTR